MQCKVFMQYLFCVSSRKLVLVQVLFDENNNNYVCTYIYGTM